MGKWVLYQIPEPPYKVYWVENNRFNPSIEMAYKFDSREEAIAKSNKMYEETKGAVDCSVEKYISSSLFIKSDGSINLRVVGTIGTLSVLLILYALLLVPQLIPFFSFIDKPVWIESVKFAIEKWWIVTSIECGFVGGVGIADIMNKGE